MPTNRQLLIIPAALLLLIFLAAAAFFGAEYYATSRVKSEINKHLQEVSQHVKVEYDGLGVNWLAFTVYLSKVKLSNPPLPGAVTIDRVRVRDLTSLGLNWIPTVVDFDQIAFDNQKTKLSIQHFSTSFFMTRIPSQKEVVDDLSTIFENLLAGDVTLENLSFSEKRTQLRLGGLAVNYGIGKEGSRNSSLQLSKLSYQKAEVKFDFHRVGLSASLNDQRLVTHLEKHVQKLSFKIPPEPARRNNVLQKLTALGYDHLTFNFDWQYDYQPKTKETNNVVAAAAENLGQLKIDLRGGDFDSPPVPLAGGLMSFLSFLDQVRTAQQEASLQSLKATYTDFGLMPRLIKAEAEARGQSPQEFTQDLVSNLNTVLLILPLPVALKKQVKAVNRFLLDPKEIQLTATFQKPLRLKELEQGSLDRVLKLLAHTDIKITAN